MDEPVIIVVTTTPVDISELRITSDIIQIEDHHSQEMVTMPETFVDFCIPVINYKSDERRDQRRIMLGLDKPKHKKFKRSGRKA